MINIVERYCEIKLAKTNFSNHLIFKAKKTHAVDGAGGDHSVDVGIVF